MSIRQKMMWSCAASALSIGSSFASAAKAEEVPVATEPLGEIIVTAEKRDVNLQRAPIAITAVSDESLKRANVAQLSDMNGLVPGLTVAKQASFNRVVVIRGVGYETPDNVSSQPGVSFHIDGVYVSSQIALAMDLLDVERVEVLRGPQGTIFGQSSTGGAINVISKRPDLGKFAAEADLSYGTYNLVKARATVNVPLSDTVAVRGAIQHFSHDGFALQTGLGYPYDLDDANSTDGRASLFWKPSDRLSLTLAAQLSHGRSHGGAQKNILDPDPDPRRITQDYPNRYALDVGIYSATAAYDLPFATIKSITSYQRVKTNNQIDNDRLTLATIGFYDNVPIYYYLINTVTQEVDVTSNNNGPLKWILGGFYMHRKLESTFVEFVGTDANPVMTIPSSLPPSGLPYNLDYRYDIRQTHKSYALFGQATYSISDRLRFTPGLRYSHDNILGTTVTTYSAYGPPLTTNPISNHLTGRALIEFDASPRNLLYASYSRGYKPGGSNNNPSPVLNSTTFEPETVNAYEIGSKNKMFDGRMTLNLAGFLYDYKNMQFQQEDPAPYQGGVANIQSARIWGVEGEISYAITPQLRFDGSATVLDGKIRKHQLVLDPYLAHQASLAAAALGYGPYDSYTINARAASERDVFGNKPPKLPGLSAQGTLTHTLELADGSSLMTSLQYIYRGKFIYRVFNEAAQDTVPSYNQFNVFIQYEMPRNIKVSLTASNIFNKAGINSRYTNPFGRFTTSNEYIAPRQIFGTISYTF